MERKITNLVTACKNKVYKRDDGKKVKGIITEMESMIFAENGAHQGK